jgi:hypothetical protein
VTLDELREIWIERAVDHYWAPVHYRRALVGVLREDVLPHVTDEYTRHYLDAVAHQLDPDRVRHTVN